MDYPSDSRAHDSGYFTPSPDKENKLTSTLINYPQLEALNNCILNNPNVRSNSAKSNAHMEIMNNPPKVVNIGNNHDMDRPPHSYIALISMAILSKSEKKILLNEIYDWVVHNFPYYQHRTDKSWRNSIRHNLSLNECFIKVGKAGNGRGYYWSIHPANINDFKKGDFRRRQARLRAKHDSKVAVNPSTVAPTAITNGNNDSSNNNSTRSSNRNNNSLLESLSTSTAAAAATAHNLQSTQSSNMSHNSNLNLSNHYLDVPASHHHHQHNSHHHNHHHHQNGQLNNSTSSSSSSSTMPNSNLCSPNTTSNSVSVSTTPGVHAHHPHHQLISNNDANNYHANMNFSPVSHNIQTMPSSLYSHHHHSPPTQQGHHHHQYNYVTFPWLAAAQQIQQASTNNFLESFTSSALACGYNSIIPHAAAASAYAATATPNEMSNDNSASLYYHNFHKQ